MIYPRIQGKPSLTIKKRREYMVVVTAGIIERDGQILSHRVRRAPERAIGGIVI